MKKTKTTLPIDIPEKLRRECDLHLAAPLTIIYNHCLNSSIYPSLWKHEWVTPAPKISNPQGITDLRKIACTSDYSKLFEKFLKEWIMEDIGKNIDIAQFGGQKGIGTEHMLVCYIDRIQKLLDGNPCKSAVLATSLDWAAAFDHQDPTIAIRKFLEMGVRPSLVPLLADYLTDRTMTVKFNNELSEIFSLIGGGPQGTLLGGVEFLVQSNDNLNSVKPEDRFKFIDDASLFQLICLAGLLMDYNFLHHIPSDIGVDEKFLPIDSLPLPNILETVFQWTNDHMMKLNTKKCSYMVFSRSNEQFATRISIDGNILEKKSTSKLLGMWISEDLSWSKHCQEICKMAYARLSLITKLKYVGVETEDLIEIYILFIRSITEYCSVVFHSSLTIEQSAKSEKNQKTCLKIILGDSYVNYEAALEMCGLQTLADRRVQRCLNFALKAVKHPKNHRLFPLNPVQSEYNTREREKYEVNFARTSSYQNSTIPFCQRLLNAHTMKG